MVRVKEGPRIGRTGRVRVSCNAAVFDNERRILLTRRKDNGRWCIPGGVLEPGETVAEGCEREVLEETGLLVRATRLIAVYSNPNRIFIYSTTDKWQGVDLLFSTAITGGTLKADEETTEVAFFSGDEAHRKDMLAHDRERVEDAFAWRGDTLIR